MALSTQGLFTTPAGVFVEQHAKLRGTLKDVEELSEGEPEQRHNDRHRVRD